MAALSSLLLLLVLQSGGKSVHLLANIGCCHDGNFSNIGTKEFATPFWETEQHSNNNNVNPANIAIANDRQQHSPAKLALPTFANFLTGNWNPDGTVSHTVVCVYLHKGPLYLNLSSDFLLHRNSTTESYLLSQSDHRVQMDEQDSLFGDARRIEDFDKMALERSQSHDDFGDESDSDLWINDLVRHLSRCRFHPCIEVPDDTPSG